MMLFGVYANVELKSEPEWLRDLRLQYKQTDPYHLTLKQPCYVDDGEIPRIRKLLAAAIVAEHIKGHQFAIWCNDIKIDTEDGSIMLLCVQYEPLMKLQRAVVASLAHYEDYYEADAEKWEKDFRPHISIATGLKKAEVGAAEKLLVHSNLLSGYSNSATLAFTAQADEQKSRPSISREVFKY